MHNQTVTFCEKQPNEIHFTFPRVEGHVTHTTILLHRRYVLHILKTDDLFFLCAGYKRSKILRALLWCSPHVQMAKTVEQKFRLSNNG